MTKSTSSQSDKNFTDFGYQSIPSSEKTEKVKGVFNSVADHYNLMNDLMSLGIHRYWKRFAISLSHLHPGLKILDLATGSGDLGLLVAKELKKKGQLVLSDINVEMLSKAQGTFVDHGILAGVDYVLANAETLPFPDHSFDRVMIGFGLRNITDKAKALSEMYRILKPGGMCLILEFSKPAFPLLKRIYDIYSFSVIPWLGKLVANDESSYRYLVESIRMHPDQETLKTMLSKAGFSNVEYFNLTGGVVALHRGYKD
jgi:demethylmenaquinone methyltransferase / 2-methoxy-6-polyprenyl-1,4-benzoquinol methylase